MLGHAQPDNLTLSSCQQISASFVFTAASPFRSLLTFIESQNIKTLNYSLLLSLLQWRRSSLQSAERDFSEPLIGSEVQQVVNKFNLNAHINFLNTMARWNLISASVLAALKVAAGSHVNIYSMSKSILAMELSQIKWDRSSCLEVVHEWKIITGALHIIFVSDQVDFGRKHF